MTVTYTPKEMQTGMANILMQGILNGFVTNIFVFDQVITANDNDQAFCEKRFDVAIGNRRFSFNAPSLSSPSSANHTHTNTHTQEIENSSETE